MMMSGIPLIHILTFRCLFYQLRGFEHIKGVILEPQTFEDIPGLLTPTMKKKRDKMLKHYKVNPSFLIPFSLWFRTKNFMLFPSNFVQTEIDDLYYTLAKKK